MKAVVIGDRETVMLFSIEGFECMQVDTQPEAQEAVKHIRRSRNYGLLIVTQKVAEWTYDTINQLRFSKELPIVIDIPDKAGPVKEKHGLEDFIREAVGIRV